MYMSRELLLKFIKNVREGGRFKFKGYINSKRKQEGKDLKNERGKDDEFETSFVDEIILQCQGKFVEFDLPWNKIGIKDRLRAYETGCAEFTT